MGRKPREEQPWKTWQAARAESKRLLGAERYAVVSDAGARVLRRADGEREAATWKSLRGLLKQADATLRQALAEAADSQYSTLHGRPDLWALMSISGAGPEGVKVDELVQFHRDLRDLGARAKTLRDFTKALTPKAWTSREIHSAVGPVAGRALAACLVELEHRDHGWQATGTSAALLAIATHYDRPAKDSTAWEAARKRWDERLKAARARPAASVLPSAEAASLAEFAKLIAGMSPEQVERHFPWLLEIVRKGLERDGLLPAGADAGARCAEEVGLASGSFPGNRTRQ